MTHIRHMYKLVAVSRWPNSWLSTWLPPKLKHLFWGKNWASHHGPKHSLLFLQVLHPPLPAPKAYHKDDLASLSDWLICPFCLGEACHGSNHTSCGKQNRFVKHFLLFYFYYTHQGHLFFSSMSVVTLP
jgi:hypothetical protein